MIPIPLKFYNVRGIKTNLNKDLPEVPGVYFIWSQKELLYIGSTDNIRRRIASHISESITHVDMIYPKEATKVCFIITQDKFEAMKIEEMLLELIPTKWNKSPFYKSDWHQNYKRQDGICGYEVNKNEK